MQMTRYWAALKSEVQKAELLTFELYLEIREVASIPKIIHVCAETVQFLLHPI